MCLGEDEEREHQLGGVAEADVEQAADAAASAFGELLGGAAEPIGEDGDCGGASDEHPQRLGIEKVAQSEGERNKQEQSVGHDRQRYCVTAAEGNLAGVAHPPVIK